MADVINPAPETLNNNELLTAFKDALTAYSSFGVECSAESEVAREEAERLALLLEGRLRETSAFMIGEEKYEMLQGSHFGYTFPPFTVDIYGSIRGFRIFNDILARVDVNLMHPQCNFAFCEPNKSSMIV